MQQECAISNFINWKNNYYSNLLSFNLIKYFLLYVRQCATNTTGEKMDTALSFRRAWSLVEGADIKEEDRKKIYTCKLY